MAEEINARIRHVGKTQAEWLADDTVLLAGELGYATDTQVIKIGNGQDTWRDLKSHQGEQGEQGPKGDPFTYDDLTEEQRLEIRGAKIDTSGFVSRAELSEAIENVDVSDQLASKADINHTHEIDDVNGLQTSLDSKAGIDHTHSEYLTQSQAEDQFVTRVRVVGDGTLQYWRGDFWKTEDDSAKVALKDEVPRINQVVTQVRVSDDGEIQYWKGSYWDFVYDAPKVALKDEVPRIEQLTQSEYDDIWDKDPNTLYILMEE